ncbi:DUF1499 domain-containing protein [uncultured Sulfitobacter sp.]|uniref:DUF1499 domain-containing protein n=1 Tax=uncultured Sulfitobacter sp. TaxID=191468 RepID=UPI00262FE8CB|nr:DUF1499 domain-containing protein [uncultured Sulfitobacter sp.]
MLGTLIFVVLVGAAAFAAHVRLSPMDAQKWHNPKLPVMGPGEYPGKDRFVGQYVLDGSGEAVLQQVHDTALATPRTRVLAGSPAEGKITYVTRTKVMGFPDVTTVTLTQIPATGKSTLQIFARLRYGKADLGVNKARVRDWVKRVGLTAEAAQPD